MAARAARVLRRDPDAAVRALDQAIDHVRGRNTVAVTAPPAGLAAVAVQLHGVDPDEADRRDPGDAADADTDRVAVGDERGAGIPPGAQRGLGPGLAWRAPRGPRRSGGDGEERGGERDEAKRVHRVPIEFPGASQPNRIRRCGARYPARLLK